MSPSPTSTPDLIEVCRHFPLLGQFKSGLPYGSGHINDTFCVVFDQAGTRVRTILQRINQRVFKNVPFLMENISRVSAHLTNHVSGQAGADTSRRVLTLIPTNQGTAYHQDAAGHCWRAYVFIEGAATHDIIRSPQQAYEAALAFGEFQRLLSDLPAPRLHETIPYFHHTRQRFETLKKAVAADAAGRVKLVGPEIDFVLRRESMVDVLLDLQAKGEIPERVTHNDTKLNNVMLDDANGRGICVIDLDTVMPGLALYDFGDMVRSATNSAAEDETDLSRVHMQMPVFEALARGYLTSAGKFLEDAEVAHLVFSARLITFEIGIRFLTDFLQGDVYFKIKRPEHNLDRSRTQFTMVSSMEAQEAGMNALVEQVAL